MPKIEMPVDWNDADGWERYYANVDPDECFMGYGSFSPSKLPNLAEAFRTRRWTSVWLPGCGISPLPKLLSLLGFDVLATDISPTAVAFQDGVMRTEDLPEAAGRAAVPGAFRCEVQDFRTPFGEDRFDVIFNVKAFQGFPPETMKRIAAVHCRALKPGRMAYFDTMNVQGEERDVFEDALMDGGFYIPYFELNRWYRQRLRETGIPHIFILGRPMIPKTGIYENDDARHKKDSAIVHGIASEYMLRADAERENEKRRANEDDRTAIVVYSTG